MPEIWLFKVEVPKLLNFQAHPVFASLQTA